MGRRTTRVQEVAMKAAAKSAEAGLRAKNQRAERLLVYTDSRGLDLTNPRGKTTAGTYIPRLARRYHVTTVVSPQKHTTIQDFLDFSVEHDVAPYAAVILHCGIVDFSPRPVSGLARVFEPKQGRPSFERMSAANTAYYAAPSEAAFEGEPTVNLYSPEYLVTEIIPRLQEFPNLIWITSNDFAPGWDGNFTRGRPTNIQEYVSRFDALMIDALPHVVSLKWWTPEQVKAWTIDNVHFTRQGFALLALLIDQAVQELRAPSAGARTNVSTPEDPEPVRTMPA